MSLVIAGNFNHYVLIAADTRVSGVNQEWYQDNDHKIFLCPTGFITGAGIVEILNPFKEALGKSNINHTSDIETIISEVILPQSQNIKKKYPDILNTTTFVNSYITLQSNQRIMRLICFGEFSNYELEECIKPIIIFPTDIEEQFKDDVNLEFYKLVEQSGSMLESKEINEDTIYENLIANSNTYQKIFKEVSNNSKYVSSNFDIVAHFPNESILYCHKADFNDKNFDYRETRMGDYQGILSPN